MESALLGQIVIYTVVFIIGIFITRAVFSIPKLLSYMRAQVKLLSIIAKKSGGDSQTIREILNAADESFAHDPHYKSVEPPKENI